MCCRWIVVSVGFAFLLAPAASAQVNQLRKAEAAEQAGQWDQAVECYLRAYVGGQQTPEVRDRLQVCLRYAAQARRFRDPTFQQFILSLPAAEAMNLYAEVLEKLHASHADKAKVTINKLFANGLVEFERAVADPAFRREQLPTATDDSLAALRQKLKSAHRKPRSVSEARAEALDVARLAQAEVGLLNPAAVVLELLHGACNGLEDYTVYLTPQMVATERFAKPAPSIEREELLSMTDGIGYIKLTNFQRTTPLELDDALLKLRDQGMRVLILDLRGNTGGLFTSGLRVAERFIPSGILATTQGQDPEFANRVFSSESGMNALDLPMVVLMDTKTMSTAEVVVAALKQQNRATLVGMPTFGKGTIQCRLRLSAADTADDLGTVQPRSGVLVLTVAKVLTARGTPINGVGVLPDVVELNPERQMALAIERATLLAQGMR